ncbi:MAG: toast rack family protein [Anaerolineaceae bacterium]
MKKPIIAVLITLLLAAFACTVQNARLETIDPQIVFISEPVPQNAGKTELIFKMSGGKFIITPDASALIEGSIKFNVEAWKPEIIRRDNFVEIKQVNPFNVKGIPHSDVENIWELRLTDALPLRLSIEGGASENIFDLTGLQLSGLNITQGASDTTIHFDAPNPILLQEFKFTTGASSANLHGLGYANFQQMTISCGAGDYTLDFSGGLNQDASVDIKSGVSNITIVIPAGLKAVVHNQGAVSNVNTRGTWLVSDQTYSTLSEGYTLTINLDLSVGNINLNHEE